MTVEVTGDVPDKPDETFAVTLSDPIHVTLGDAAATGTIVDDDEPPVLSVTNVTVTEGAAAEAVFTVALSAESGFDITVDYATADGTATASLDYDPAAGELSFPAGTTSRKVAVAIVDDSLDEDNETFLLTLANAVHAVLPAGPGVATIVDDDESPEISVGDVTVTEGDTEPVEAVFIVSLSVVSGREVRVGYTTADGDATAGEDYRFAAGTVSFPAGERSQQVIVVVDGDVDAEADETFLLQLSNPVAGILADAQGVGTILDDDVPVLSASKNDSLAVDHDGDGVVSPGDTVGYEILIENLGTGAATEVAFDDLITNTGTGTLTIDRITLTWPSENGSLKKVKLGKKTIYDDQLPPPTATIDSGWKGGGKDREIKSGKTEELKFEFVHDAVPGGFVSDAP